jgi:TPR repeat protein
VSSFVFAIQNGQLPLNLAQVRKLCFTMFVNHFAYEQADWGPEMVSNHMHPDPEIVTRVAHVLSRSRPHRNVALAILRRMALQIHEPLAVIGDAFTTLKSPRDVGMRSEVWELLDSLVRRGTHPQAMVVYSYYLVHRGNPHHALQWAERAFHAAKPIPKKDPACIDNFLPREVHPPWSVYADAATHHGLKDRAREALEVGAHQFHSPEAYVRLAQHIADNTPYKSLDKFTLEEYLLKSAMAGAGQVACYLLGNLYMRAHLLIQDDPTFGAHPKAFESKYPPNYYRMMAVEWFHVAMRQGSPRAGINLALLLSHEKREYQDAKPYLAIASRKSEYDEDVVQAKSYWATADEPVQKKNVAQEKPEAQRASN